MSTVDRAQRVADIVEEALERDGTEQRALLDTACAGDPALRAEVESLLGFRGQAETFIEQPAIEANAELLADSLGELTPGDAIGPYRVVSLLGEGGMGEVYLADDTSLGRQVAIKLVKRGFGRANLIRHFHHEERILATLNHPNIARLYGAGMSEDGTPYFVMEYVEGERLDQYCAVRRLGVPERLQLFRKICSAVAYAHQHLIIHRDLKPANIRVTPDGEPKLLDFGIAKLLQEDEAASLAQTVTVAGAMTPEYASPEQIRGDPMTTASDIYSLGVVLYELLTGRKPYRLTSHSPDDVSRAITTQSPVRPSQAVLERAKQIPPVSPSEIANPRLLRGDLDNIVLMALRKEPERRYSSVALFAEDIRRHVDGLPVLARKDTLRYRSAKFIRRHKLAVAAAAVLLLTLLAGIVATTWQAQRAEQQRALAERRFAEVRRLANSLVFELHGAIENLPGSTAARELLVRRALEYLDSLAREAHGDTSLQRELAAAYVRIGNAQGNPNNANLGDTAGALRSYRESLAISERLLAADSTDLQARRSFGVALEKLSEVQSASGEVAAAVQSARKSLEAFKSIAEANSKDAAAQRSLAISYLKVGDVSGNPNFPNANDTAGALASYRSSLEILQALHAADPASTQLDRLVGVLQERIGTMLLHEGRIDEARESYLASQEIRERLAAAQPENAEFVRDTAIAHEKIANVQSAAGDRAAAIVSRRKSLEIFDQLARADLKNVQAQQSVAISHMHLADLLASDEAARNEALQQYRRGLEVLEAAQARAGLPAKARDTAAMLRQRITALESAR
jgi:eukaryotic-like serine/threonine-protein kinase